MAGISSSESEVAQPSRRRWPGWPGQNVFRLVVPVKVVGVLIGKKGEVIKRIMKESGAKLVILKCCDECVEQVVLVTGKEELDAQASPAMDAILGIFHQITGVGTDADVAGSSATGILKCKIQLLAASLQAVSLIGKAGTQIRAINDNTGVSVKVLSADDMPSYATSDEKIIKIQGDSWKVLKALNAVIGHLRKFLVDCSILPLFEKGITVTIQVPLIYSEEIIGRDGVNIEYIRRVQVELC